MHLTSGTTGAPKGLWSGLLDAPAAEALADEERAWAFEASDVLIELFPPRSTWECWCTVPEHARVTYWNAPEKTARTW